MKRYAIAPLFCLLTFSVDGIASRHTPANFLHDEDAAALRVCAVYKMNRLTRYDYSIAKDMIAFKSNQTVQKLKLRSTDVQHALNVLTQGVVYIEENNTKTGYYMLDDGDRNDHAVHDAFFNKFNSIFVKSSEPLDKSTPKKRQRSAQYSKKDLSVHPFPISDEPNKVNLAIWNVSEGVKADNLTKITLKHIETPSLFNYREIIARFFERFEDDAEARVVPYGTANATVTFEMDEPISNRTASIKVTTTFNTMKPQHLANKDIPWYLSMTSQQGNTHYKFDIKLNHSKATQNPTLGFLEMTFNG
jgi:hypothetical protein